MARSRFKARFDDSFVFICIEIVIKRQRRQESEQLIRIGWVTRLKFQIHDLGRVEAKSKSKSNAARSICAPWRTACTRRSAVAVIGELSLKPVDRILFSSEVREAAFDCTVIDDRKR